MRVKHIHRIVVHRIANNQKMRIEANTNVIGLLIRSALGESNEEPAFRIAVWDAGDDNHMT